MKKIVLLVFFILEIFSYASNKITTVDEGFLINNYEKTKKYNFLLEEKKRYLEEKYSLNFNDNVEELRKNEEYLEYEKLREEYVREIKSDVEWVMFLTCEEEFLFDKRLVLFGKTKDISKKTLKNLNKIYKFENQFKNFDKNKNLETLV
ncbi:MULTISPECIES: hypothetical protein [Fusobacterium]|uniref:hypothetical protein n=1 Tax=Fusobacterium TaxID=848 RepID=UPI001476B65D|nr:MULTISPECIES: hypothetical protein [Fusobacterium]NME36458.1 hypothetical protein [Fusobacterium sp. FSA-380-WT-3A]